MSKKSHQRKVVVSNGVTHYVNPLRDHKEILWIRQTGRCWICGELMARKAMKNADGSHDGRHATIDHLIPQARGGTDDIRNLALACYACNCLRGRHILQPLGQQLYAAEFKLFTAQEELASLRETIIRQNDDLRTAGEINDVAWSMLQAERMSPLPVCTCWYCRTKSILAGRLESLAHRLAER